MNDQRHHVGITPHGELKAALATGREDHAHFGIKLVVRFEKILKTRGLSLSVFEASDQQLHKLIRLAKEAS